MGHTMDQNPKSRLAPLPASVQMGPFIASGMARGRSMSAELKPEMSFTIGSLLLNEIHLHQHPIIA